MPSSFGFRIVENVSTTRQSRSRTRPQNKNQCERLQPSAQGLKRRQDLLICRSHLVIDLDEFPPNDPLLVDYIGGRMRQALAAFVKNAVAIDYLVLRIR